MSQDNESQTREFQTRMTEMFRNMPPPPKPEADGGGQDDGVKTERQPEGIHFDMKPEELEAYLDQYVVRQDRAKEVLATKICTHFNKIRLGEPEDESAVGHIKNNILMIGPTGVGKTYLIKLIARKIGVPFVKGDATKFSETGYVGGDVEDLVRDLVRDADGDIERAQVGIIYIDEIDKIAASGSWVGPDVSRTGVQRNLLKLMEETEVDMRVPHDLASQMEAMMQFQRTGKVEKKKVNTRNILFIVSGAFSGLEDRIQKRLHKQTIGFGADHLRSAEVDGDLLKRVKSEDLIEYGFESEFVGRLPVVAVLDELTEEDLYHILKNPESSVIVEKKRDFQAYGIKMGFEEDALREMARMAYPERTGARGLVSVFEKVLLKFEKKLPSTDIKRFVLTADMVQDPDMGLARLLTEAPVQQYQEDFLRENAIHLSFTPAAIQCLADRAGEKGEEIGALCRELLDDYGYGLKLTHAETFEVTEEVIEDSKGVLDRMIKTFYGKK
ncbi:MAG: AAA family ATPase [Candidatus Latescibacterota bacterium]